MTNIIGIVGSPNKNGRTNQLVIKALIGAETAGAETEMMYLGEEEIQPCGGCKVQKCWEDTANPHLRLPLPEAPAYTTPAYEMDRSIVYQKRNDISKAWDTICISKINTIRLLNFIVSNH